MEGAALAAPITAVGDGIYDGPRAGSLTPTDARGLPHAHGIEVADDDSAVSSHHPPVVEKVSRPYLSTSNGLSTFNGQAVRPQGPGGLSSAPG